MMLSGTGARRSPAYAATAVRSLTMRQYAKNYARPTVIPFPTDNSPTPEREALGRTLFFDPRLSGSNRTSCASCHNPALSWGDGLARAVGHANKPLGRRTPTILNLAWSDSMFWDGRAESLEEQALGPIQAPGEMNLPLDRMVAKIGGIPGYQTLFARGYPGEPIAETTGADPGRGTILPDIAAMQHAFKTPTLRNVARRAPYMHDGSIAHLEDVVELYDQGGLDRRPSLAVEIRRLHLTPEEKQDVVAFLCALTSTDAPVEIPTLPR
jgi:cytochrome c peroxidase